MRKMLLGALAGAFLCSAAWADTMSVQFRQVDVKSTPNYLSSTVGQLNYGSSVETVGEEGNWVRISQPSGWIPKSAVTKSKIAIKAGQKFTGRGASVDEVALAGKGFNPQVEAKYKSENPSLAAAYTKVDWLEAQTIPLPALKAFATAGRLGF